jgi:transposase
MLDFVPGYVKVLRHIRPKLASPHCENVVQLSTPVRPLERTMPAPALLAQVIVAKYADHCALHRQQVISRRADVKLSTGRRWLSGRRSSIAPPLLTYSPSADYHLITHPWMEFA